MPPFGFGLSMPSLRKAGGGAAPPAPTVLLTELWVGSDVVDGKVPTTGGGTWIAPNNMTYSSGQAYPDSSSINTAFHSATYTNVRFSGISFSGTTGPAQNQPLFIYARANANDSASPDCYYVTCNAIPATIVLSKRVGGVATDLGTFAADTANGETVGLQTSGSGIKVYYNDTVVISVIDTAITTAGYWGFGLTYGAVGEDTGNSSIGVISIQTA